MSSHLSLSRLPAFGRGLLVSSALALVAAGAALADGPRHGFLGVEAVEITPELAEHLGAPGGGVLIGRIVEGSPAEEAGLAVGDVLVEVAGRRVESRRELSREIRFFDAGEAVELLAVRDGAELRFTADLEAAPTTRRRTTYLGPHDIRVGDLEDLEVDLADLAHELGSIGISVGAGVGAALAGIDWEEIGDEIRDAVEESLEELEDLEIEMDEIRIELDEDLRDLEEELEEELEGELRIRRDRV